MGEIHPCSCGETTRLCVLNSGIGNLDFFRVVCDACWNGRDSIPMNSYQEAVKVWNNMNMFYWAVYDPENNLYYNFSMDNWSVYSTGSLTINKETANQVYRDDPKHRQLLRISMKFEVHSTECEIPGPFVHSTN